ncbi:putative tubulin-specific chaperone [Babesia divergens]|uniref:Tubulin-specific chaperone n=1 Tax=Babesia divergens TaxID=32595 RepID=A0AAD9GAF0_BABDI|nr:putative tubulin-specific chaperone [Babesia divergens]
MDIRSQSIKVDLRHSELRDRRWSEIRLDNCITIGELKQKLYSHCGTPTCNMALYAYDPNDMIQTQVFLDNDDMQLYTYGVKDGHVIYICVLQRPCRNPNVATRSKYARLISSLANCPLKDTNSRMYEHYMQQLERCQAINSESAFQQYRMSDEEYDRRGRGLRNFIAQMRARTGGNPEEDNAKTQNKSLDELKREYPLESRCMVMPGALRGTVKFVGMVNNRKCIGIDLDEPFGKCNGSIGNIHYFSAKGDQYGAFYNYENVQIGDFPEVDPFDSA